MTPAFGPKTVPAYYPGPDQQQLMGIERQRALAQALMQDSLAPLQAPQSGGRLASPVSPLAPLAKVLQAAAAGYGMKKADDRTADLVTALRGRQSTALERIAAGPQPNAPGGITQPSAPPAAAPSAAPVVPGDITQPEVKPFNPSIPQGQPDTPADMATALHTPGGIQPNFPVFGGTDAPPQQIEAPGVGISGKTPKQETAAEFAMRVRIIANQLNLDPAAIMAMPEVGGKYAQLLDMEKEGRGFQRDLEKFEYQDQVARGQEKFKRGLAAGDIKDTITAQDGTIYGRKLDGTLVPLGNAGVDMNKALIPDGNGGWKINQPYVDAQSQIAKARSINVGVNNYPNPIAVTDPKTGETKMVQFGNKGDMREVPYGPAEQTKPTDTERLAKGYHSRMEASEAILNKVGQAGFPTVGTNVAGAIPGVGAYAERNAMTPAQQQYRQAQEDWVRAKLRKESGAVIGKDEMDREISVYFPQPGDSPEVITQKSEARAVAIQAMRDAAGPAIPRAPAMHSGVPAGKPNVDDLVKKYAP